MGTAFAWSRRALASSLLLVSWLGGSPQASAQSVTIERFRPSETVDDAFQLSRPDDFGHVRVSTQLHLSYANDPLVYEADLGDRDSESARVVGHHLVGTIGAAIGLYDRFVVFAALPVDLLMSGDDGVEALGMAPADIFGLGDISLGGRARVRGDTDDLIGLGVQLTLTVPTGGGNYRGDDNVTVQPEVLFEVRPGLLRLTTNLGARIRENQRLQGGVLVGDELTFALGATYPVWGSHLEPGTTRVDVHAQLYGNTAFTDFFDRESTPLELIAGGKLHHESGIVAGVAAGLGLSRGVGSPDARIIGTLGWATPVSRGEPGDRDGDGLADGDDDCPDEPEDFDDFEDADGCPDPDNDGDGVLDAADECPLQPGEAINGGCPASGTDSDGDGILDSADQCPSEPEDFDDFEDTDGCPDPDNDGDGVLDAEDRCIDEPGPADSGGCPDTDRDEDTVVDRLDNCPDEAGTPENQGCAEEQQVVIRGDRLEILDKVYFGTDSDRIQRRSYRLLENVAAVLKNHPEIEQVRVEGHTDDRGDDDHNKDLSQRRAEAVQAFLVERGVEASRLSAHGFGEEQPIETNDTPEGRAANRRVEFNLGGEVEGVERAEGTPTQQEATDR